MIGTVFAWQATNGKGTTLIQSFAALVEVMLPPAGFEIKRNILSMCWFCTQGCTFRALVQVTYTKYEFDIRIAPSEIPNFEIMHVFNDLLKCEIVDIGKCGMSQTA